MSVLDFFLAVKNSAYIGEPFKILCKMYSVTFASAKFISSLPRLDGGGVTGFLYHWACSI